MNKNFSLQNLFICVRETFSRKSNKADFDCVEIAQRMAEKIAETNMVFTRSSQLPAKFQQTSSKHPAGLMEPRRLSAVS